MSKYSIGTVHPSNNYSDMTIIDMIDYDHYIVEFADTGYTTEAARQHIGTGNVRDYMVQSVFGKGFLGGKEYPAYKRKNNHATPAYTDWYNMLEVCYGNADILYGTNLTVCEEWLNFQTFAKWHSKQATKDKELVFGTFGKDTEFSPTTSYYDVHGSVLSMLKSRTYKLVSPEGVLTDITNLNEFCRTNSFDIGAVSKMLRGTHPAAYGWCQA